MLDNNTNQLELGKQLTLEWNWIGIRLLKIITENNAKFFGKQFITPKVFTGYVFNKMFIGEILTLWNMCYEYLRLALLEHKDNLEDYQLQENLENYLQIHFEPKRHNYGNIPIQYNYYTQ